jgi:nicotinate-nucleotide adenylyltransferase
MRKIVIFGGVFDPPHIGHLNIYLSIKKQFKFDKFYIVPSKIPPLKNHYAYASANDRRNMVKLMFNKYRDVEICDYELSKKTNKTSYSIDTIKYFKTKYPKDELFFAIGLDRYSDFQK